MGALGSQGENTLRVGDFMSTDLTTLQETDSLLDATLTFMKTRYRHLPVLAGTKLVGIVTTHDVREYVPSLMTRGGAEEYNSILEMTSVSKAMTREPITATSNQPVSEAADVLYTRKIGSLPVVDGEKLVGVITTSDMLKILVLISRGKTDFS
jgi:acetoin utilization protein AcuB